MHLNSPTMLATTTVSFYLHFTDTMGVSLRFFSFMDLVLCLSLCHLAHFTFMQSLCHDDERSALLQFKESLIIDKFVSSYPSAYVKVASWKPEGGNSDCCSWDGIECDKVTGHVIKLDLTSSFLYGNINSTSSLFHLIHLQWLSLADNDFNESKISPRIINLSGLSHLDLSFSGFSGQIPSEMLKLCKLKSLNLSYNHLEFQKPGLTNLVEKLTSLEMLDLSKVNISSSISHIFTNMSSLAYLSLQGCQLQGEFPTQIFRLPNLSVLNVKSNPDLTGYLPNFEKSSPLEDLRLAGSRFSGQIPDSIGNLKSLSYMDITGCNFSGTIPSSLGNLTKIRNLYLSENKFSGELPTFLAKLSFLEELDLSHNNFSGRNSGSLTWMSKLSKLTYLGLSDINLAGEIPSWLMNLTRLTHLYMSHNELTGPIPFQLMNLNQLVELTLASNQLTGHIPSQIKNLTQLLFLSLGSNQLHGSIPSALFDLKNLHFLDLGSNNLSGTLDLNILLYKLKSLKDLVLSSNNLSLLTKTHVHKIFQKLQAVHLGSCNLIEFPNFLQNQDHLEILDLSFNKIAGLIPGWLSNLSSDGLLVLDLSGNLLTGFEQHPLFFSWTRLSYLDFGSNKLQGPLPVPPLSTRIYRVSSNNLTGEIPPAICNLNRLKVLDLSYNNFSGKLPQCLGNFSHLLSELNLQNNKFNGRTPEFVNGRNLRMIDLSHNLLEGRIPRSLANSTNLEFLNFGNNQISDTFPSWLETLPKLKVLMLLSNRLRGVIREPKTDYAFPELRIIDLSHNRFTGNLPSKYFESWHAMKVVNESRLTYMQEERSGTFLTGRDEYIDTFAGSYDFSLQMSTKGIELAYRKVSNLLTAIVFSNNKFEGEIPASITNLRELHFLTLSNNNLQGPIPPSMGNLIELESLDLSNNMLSGRIPQQLAELTFLAYFNVSYNQLTGPIPPGKQFDTFESNSFAGNPGLCGKQIEKKCENFQGFKKEDPGSESPFEFGWKIVLIGYASGIVTGVALEHAFAARKRERFGKIFERKLKIIRR